MSFYFHIVIFCQWLIPGCPSGFKKFGDSCYYFSSVSQRLNFDESSQFCANMSSYMLIINDNEEQVNKCRP